MLHAVGGASARETERPDRRGALLLLGYVDTSLRTAVTLREPKVNEEDSGDFFAKADAKILGLEVAVDEVLLVHGLNALNQLRCHPEHGFDAELLPAEVEEILDCGAEKIHHQYVEFSLNA